MSRGVVRVRLAGSAGTADSLMIASKQGDEREQTHPLVLPGSGTASSVTLPVWFALNY